MKTNKNIFKIMTISIVTLFLFNCSDDFQEDNALSEELNLQKDDLSTVPLESTLDFFNSLNTTNRLNRVSGDQNNIGLEIDIASLEQVDISDTDAKLNIANATTKFDNVETQVLQIEIDGTLQTVLFHHIPEDTTASNRSSSRTTGYSFTGSVFTTNLSGTVLSGFRINLGNISGSFNFSTPIYNTDPDPCWDCGIPLDEVVVTATSPSNYAAVNHTTMNNRAYQWGRSNNNYSSMGTAYANYYWQKAARNFYNRIKNELSGKSDCVYDKLFGTAVNNHNLIRSTFIEFGGQNYTQADLTYRLQNNLVNSEGEVISGSFQQIENEYIISLNADLIAGRSPIEIARTIIHESTHALLRRRYNSATGAFIELFGEYMRQYSGSNDITHAIMRDHYISQISNTLKQFDNNRENQQFYDDLAWEGLHEFLPQEDINRIIETINEARDRGLDCN
jgi:hypothetical protein